MLFTGKIIWILSPEKWGILKVSKHQYAIELVKRGNTVYFLEPPDLSSLRKGRFTTTEEGVRVLNYKPLARGKRFAGRKLFSLLQQVQFRYFEKRYRMKPDIVWCFDDGNFDDLRIFKAGLVIFHPVDHSVSRTTPPCARSADVVFSTSTAILQYMAPPGKPSFFIRHGLSEPFALYAKERMSALSGQDGATKAFNKKVGFWGSLFKESLDKRKIRTLIKLHPECHFSFWGPADYRESNIGGRNDEEVADFIRFLRSCGHVSLKGPRTGPELVREIADIDVFLNIEFEFSTRWDNGNPHKVLEYLATGKPVFSTPVLMYADLDFFYVSRQDGVADDFNRLLAAWDRWNAKEAQIRRLQYALDNTYTKQVGRIEQFVAEL